jgi:hypothetical protein
MQPDAPCRLQWANSHGVLLFVGGGRVDAFCGALYAFKTVSVVHVASRRGMSKARSRINAPPTREHVQEAPSPTMK